MKECPGVDMAALRKLAGALARDAIFGKDELRASSLKGGRKSKTKSLCHKEKLDYIKTVIRSRVPKVSPLEFEAIWEKCRATISKMCQYLRDSAKNKK